MSVDGSWAVVAAPRRSRRWWAAVVVALVVSAGCTVGGTAQPISGGGPAAAPAPVAGHPRLLVRDGDLARLRSWAGPENPIFAQGLAVLAGSAKAEMDAGKVPAGDGGTAAYERYPTEVYAELFAFLSMVDRDEAARSDYGRRAHDLLMSVIAKALPGPAGDDVPFRDPRFATFDRSRWQGEAFGLTVDWAYPYFSAADKAQIREVFLRWSKEQFSAYPLTEMGDSKPTLGGPVNDPVLLADPVAARWALNNYFAAHTRNLAFMALALDPADDAGDELRGMLRSATGSWFYMTDQLQRGAGAGGLSPEGTEYASVSLGFMAQFLVALHTAGQDDPAKFGPQVVLAESPFWKAFLPAMLHSLSPVPVQGLGENAQLGRIYLPAAYGDLQTYAFPDLIDTVGPLALYAADRGDRATVDAIRWFETQVPPGGAEGLLDRVGHTDQLFSSILYFLTFDPGLPPPADPRPSAPLLFTAPGIHRLMARTCWCDTARWFTYSLTWKTIDHQGGDGNEFELYRGGEWLTKQHTGYDTTWYSDYHNTLTIENAPVTDSDQRWQELSRRGSQQPGSVAGDPTVLATGAGEGYVYALGDATNLYNSAANGATDVTHASRSVIWLQPDHVIVYDRADTKTAGRFKRFWLQLPAAAQIAGDRATARTPGGQQLLVTSLQPVGAAMTVEAAEPDAGRPAVGDPMTHRLRIEAPGGPARARFLTVVQGADGGAAGDPATLTESTAGRPYVAATVAGTAALFPVDVGTEFAGFTIALDPGVRRILVTGLRPGTGYTATVSPTQLVVAPGGTVQADAAGMLVLNR